MSSHFANRPATREEKQALSKYIAQNQALFMNPVIRGFFESPEHVSLLCQYILFHTTENRSQLERAFRRYFFQIRFTKYLGSLIRFCDIDYHRKRTREEQRNQLVFDTPVDESGDATLGELIYSISHALEDEFPVDNPASFQQLIMDESLFLAFNQLTDKQKLVITFAYSSCALDTEIATLFRISQQAITKTRLSALKKMRNYIERLPEGTPKQKHEARKKSG